MPGSLAFEPVPVNLKTPFSGRPSSRDHYTQVILYNFTQLQDIGLLSFFLMIAMLIIIINKFILLIRTKTVNCSTIFISFFSILFLCYILFPLMLASTYITLLSTYLEQESPPALDIIFISFLSLAVYSVTDSIIENIYSKICKILSNN
jgi:hypothetical protein